MAALRLHPHRLELAGTSRKEPPRDRPRRDTLLTLVGRARLNEGDNCAGDAPSARNMNFPRRTVPFKGSGWGKSIGIGVEFGSESVAEFVGI
jgi:hypothetical protein